MKKLLSGYSRLLMVSMLIILTCIFCPGYAQQQQYANAYTYWDFGQDANDVQNVEQKIWIAMPAFSTQWVMTWAWVANPAHGGYLGFNTDKNGGAGAFFFVECKRGNRWHLQGVWRRGSRMELQNPF